MQLSEVLAAQAVLQGAMRHPMGYGEAAVKENALAAIVEWTEVLGEINWKPWRKERLAVDRTALAAELADVLQFWANAVNAAGLTADDVVAALRAKWKTNEERIKNGY